MIMTIEIINQNCNTYLTSPWCVQFDMIFADPPFNIDHGYKEFVDVFTKNEYREFTTKWVSNCWEKLRSGGILIAHGSITVSREILRAALLLNLDSYIENEIIQYYGFGQHQFNNWIDNHCRAIVFRKPDGVNIFNAESVLVPSRRLLMGDKRIATAKYKGMVVPGNVWGIKNDNEPWKPEKEWGRCQGNNKERVQYMPNQLREKYLERFILAYTNEGNIVFDPFGGSGTTAVVCQELKRSCKTTEIQPITCELIKERLNRGCINVRRQNSQCNC